MNSILRKIAYWITRTIDLFYRPPLSRYFTLEVFRYAFCGGGNLVFDWLLYFLVYNFGLRHQMVHIGAVTLSSHIATLVIVYPITLMTGFYLAKYVTFTRSNIDSHIQAVRYIMVSVGNLMLNYFGLKLLVEVVGLYPTPSKVLITIVAVIVSYLAQKHFTFRNVMRQFRSGKFRSEMEQLDYDDDDNYD